MPSRAVLVPALLCFIIQVAFTPCVLGSDGKSRGSSSTDQEQILLKRSNPLQGLSKLSSLPELVNLTLQATLYGITARWSLKIPTTYSYVSFLVSIAGVNTTVWQNSYNISGLACNTSYDVTVSLLDVNGQDYSNLGATASATIMTKGVPELVDLELYATLNEITAYWSPTDRKCFPDVRYRVTTAGVEKIVSQNFYTISGLARNTSYYVEVSPVDANGASYGVSANATILTNGVPKLFNLTLQATMYGITARWSLYDPTSFPDVRFRVSTAGVNETVSQNSYNISGLACNTQYYVNVSPVDAYGAPYGVSKNASVTTKGVPELENLGFYATTNEVTVYWSPTDRTCFPELMFRVTTAEVMLLVWENVFSINGLTCNTSYFVEISPFDWESAYYGVSSNLTFTTKGVPDLGILSLTATLYEITARWSQTDPKCFPVLRYRVTTAGVDKIVSQNSYTISGLACNASYYVEVSPIDADGVTYGVSTNATIITKGIPELVNLTLQATLNEIKVSWSLKDPKCFPDVRFRVITAGVNQIVSQNSYNISGLACNTSYYVKVSPVDAAGAAFGISTNATIITKGVPDLVNLTLQAKLYEIKASWSLKEPKCSPDVRYRVITAGVDKTVSQNSFNISGLACNTSYYVKVSPVNAAGATFGGSTNATIITNGVPELVNLTLTATLYEIKANWSLKDPKCFPVVRFRVTTAGVDQIVSQNSSSISGLACNKSYYVKVSPVDAAGATYGVSTNASIITKGVPELVNLTLTTTLNAITASWSLKEPKCFPNVRFRVTTAGVDKIVSQNFSSISGLACNTSYYVKVSPVDAANATYGGSRNATIITMGVPELVNLTLTATLYEIKASWALKEPKCFPDVRYRVTTAGVDKIVPQNFSSISGLACNTSYYVQVSPVDAANATYGGSRNATIITKGVPELANLTLTATLYEIKASWSLKDPKCFPDVRYRVITSGVDKTVLQNSYNISGLACNTSYYVKVSPVDAAGATNGVSTNASIITKGVPELANLTLTATLNEITASWSLKEPKCFPDVRYRVTAAGVDKIVTQNSFNIVGLACNTSYYVKVSPVDAVNATYGGSRNATIITNGVPEVANLTLQATTSEVTARWSLKNPNCFSNVRYRVTTAGVNSTVSQNSYNISGLDCDTYYNVKVSPVDANGSLYGVSTSASISTNGVTVYLMALVAESLVVKWVPLQGSCQNFVSYELTLSQLSGALVRKNITQKTHIVFAGLNATTVYKLRFQPLDSRGVAAGPGAIGQRTTFNKTSTNGRCPYPTFAMSAWSSFVMCAGVMKPTPSTNLEANRVCSNKYPATTENPYIALMFFVATGTASYGTLQEYLRMFDYTEDLLVNGFYRNGSWVWGIGTNYATTYKIDPALLVGLPPGGDGPDDYKMLYADPAKDFNLSVAKDGRSFGGMICGYPLKY